jgi:hypothetical protein
MDTSPRLTSKLREISAVAELGEEAMALLRQDLHPLDFVALMLEKGQFPDAVRFIAHALPKREAVWWGWVCARRAAGDSPAPKIKDAAAEKAELGTAAGCAGLAAFFSGGSIAPPNAAAVPPGEFLTAKAVSGAVIFAAVATDPEKAPEKFRSFVAQGLEVTKRVKLWEPQG